MGPGQSAGRPGGLPPDDLARAEPALALDWLPLASLLLAADGTAPAVSHERPALSGLTAEDSPADGWVSAVEPLDRGVLRARLRDAAVAGQAGYTDARLAGRPARRSRWWRPVPSGRLRPSRYAARTGPRPATGPPGHDLSAVADMLVRRLFAAGLALQAASALAEGPVAARLQQVLDQLDGIIQDARTAVFESRAPQRL